jgi:hypothetical protein
LSARARRQRVTLRLRRRRVLTKQIQVGFVRSLVLAILLGLGVGLGVGRQSFLRQVVDRHTPQVDLVAPGSLSGLPVLSDLPAQRFWLWCPGMKMGLERRLVRKYRIVRGLRLEKHFQANRIVLRLEPRVPLVLWNDAGLDREGVAFGLAPGTWKTLPRVDLSPAVSPRLLSGWLSPLVALPRLWSQVVSIGQDSLSNMELVLKTGAHVIWGPLEATPSLPKAQALLRVLDDAHEHLGGASRADLRFFDQGRIIVLPKGK